MNNTIRSGLCNGWKLLFHIFNTNMCVHFFNFIHCDTKQFKRLTKQKQNKNSGFLLFYSLTKKQHVIYIHCCEEWLCYAHIFSSLIFFFWALAVFFCVCYRLSSSLVSIVTGFDVDGQCCLHEIVQDLMSKCLL